MQEWNLIQHIRQPLAFLFPVDIQSPDGVIEWFCTHIHLRCQWLFRQMHERTTNLKVLREVIFPVQTKHCLALLLVTALAFQRYVDSCSSINDTLIQYRYLSSTVVNAVIRALCQGDTTGCYNHRTLWNVVCTK